MTPHVLHILMVRRCYWTLSLINKLFGIKYKPSVSISDSVVAGQIEKEVDAVHGPVENVEGSLKYLSVQRIVKPISESIFKLAPAEERDRTDTNWKKGINVF